MTVGTRLRVVFALSICTLVLGGCATADSMPRAGLLPGGAASKDFPSAVGSTQVKDYRIGPLDKINVAVFGEKDLSINEIQVDSAGNILFPLIGDVRAQGKTTSELSAEIAARLAKDYLVNPQVTVGVASSVSQKVIVEGSVNEAGVYEIRGPTTLLEALALAKGPSRTAALNRVAIFRTINGKRMGAMFDVAAIRDGRSSDPEVIGNDIVVVAGSGVKAAWRDFLSTAPILTLFRGF